MRPHAAKARGGVFELGELDLQAASCVRARLAKMSRISSLRSITLQLQPSSSSRSCAGERSLSKMTTSASSCPTRSSELFDLALADVKAGIDAVALLQHLVHHDRAGGLGQRRQLLERFLRIVRRVRTREGDQDRPLLQNRILCALFFVQCLRGSRRRAAAGSITFAIGPS